MIWPQSCATVNLRAQILPVGGRRRPRRRWRSACRCAANSDAAAGDRVAGLVLARRGRDFQPAFSAAALITAMSRGSLTWRRRSSIGSMTERGRDLVHERFAGEVDLRPDRIAQMRAAQRRAAVEQRRDRLPGHALVGELVGFRGHAEGVVDLSGTPRKWPASVSGGLLPLVCTSMRENPLLVNS